MNEEIKTRIANFVAEYVPEKSMIEAQLALQELVEHAEQEREEEIITESQQYLGEDV